jgi:hypothetical protein
MCRIIDKVGYKILGTYGPWLSLLAVDLMIILTTIITPLFEQKHENIDRTFRHYSRDVNSSSLPAV